MPIDSVHEEYVKRQPDWSMIEDFIDGDRAVKAAGKKYLPQLSGQSTAKYNAYKDRAVLYGALPRTVAALVGAVFRKAPSFVIPDKLKYLEKNANGDNVGLIELAIRLTTEVMSTGRASILVDRPTDGGLPYLLIRDADDCINWNTDIDNTFFVLEDETLIANPKDKFDLKKEEGYRELTYDENGFYIVNIWRRENKNKDSWVIKETIQPLRNGKPIEYIPFTFITPYGTGTEVAKPPMLDMAYVSRLHYCVSADLALANHTTSLPTPVISADINKEDNFVLNLGPDTCIMLPQGGSATMLTYGAEGLASVEKLMDRYEQMLAALGARVIDTRKSSIPDTAESVRTKEAVAGAVTAAVISAVESALEKALRWVAEWENADPEGIKVRLNRELVSPSVDANMLTSLTAALQSGAISHETYWKNLEEGGLTDPSISYDEEIKRIKEAVQDPNSPTGGITDMSNISSKPSPLAPNVDPNLATN